MKKKIVRRAPWGETGGEKISEGGREGGEEGVNRTAEQLCRERGRGRARAILSCVGGDVLGEMFTQLSQILLDFSP